MKKLLLLSSIILAATFAKAGIISDPDSLIKAQIEVSKSDTVKAKLYNDLANHYMAYAAIQDRELRTAYQENALNYTLKALHHYYRIDDSTSMRACYDRLSRVYRDQKKFSQAKWFILQSNTMARNQNDQANIVASLITLAGIKMDIKDYDLAVGDLKEALSLSSVNRYSDQQTNIMLAYARLYNSTHKPTKAAAAMKRYAFMKDSMKRDSQLRRMAKLGPKKKYYLASNKVQSNSKGTQSVSL